MKLTLCLKESLRSFYALSSRYPAISLTVNVAIDNRMGSVVGDENYLP
jgi:hypothetical protein